MEVYVYCREGNWIFVHIQKTGGNSVCTALGASTRHPDKHRSAVELREAYGHEAWDNAFTFAWVRNPWERILSWWSMIESQRSSYGGCSRFQQLVLDTASNFEDFLLRFDGFPDDEFFKSNWLFRPQIAMISDECGRSIVDFVGRFERLVEDWQVVARRVGRPGVALPHVNQSSHGPYQDYYSPRTRDIVARHFATDIRTFGYAFDGE
ncbi:MAG TPA: sulfotransferase family 2 domain-containing protein [Xanthomonadaceae bacterium]|nr:sulfotransferase family 2 domain-containing protein [Xanthomonadaceae bacterium]